VLRFGRSDHIPLAGDLDGDGDDDPCVRRGRSFLCDTAHNGGLPEVNIPLGIGSDEPALGDLDGDGDDDLCIWRPSTGTFLCDATHDGAPDLAHAVDAEVRAYLLHLTDEKKLAPASVNQALAGIRFLYLQRAGSSL
jgi:hypothetical protein